MAGGVVVSTGGTEEVVTFGNQVKKIVTVVFKS